MNKLHIKLILAVSLCMIVWSTSTLANNNVISNPGFENGFSEWNPRTGNNAQANFTIGSVNSPVGNFHAIVEGIALGSPVPKPWDIQIKRNDFDVIAGQEYEISFWAKADVIETIEYAPIRSSNNQAIYNGSAALTNSWQFFSGSFTPTADENVNFIFNLGNQINTYYFDQIEFSAIGNQQCLPDAEICLTTSSPGINGSEGPVWENPFQYPIQNILDGVVSGNLDLGGYYKVIWDATYLYFVVNVTDDMLTNDSPATNPYDDDGVEIYIDANNSKSSTYDANDFQFLFRRNDPDIYLYPSGIINPPGVVAAHLDVTGGYIYEIRMEWNALGVMPGSEIGLDVHINDDDDGGGRDAKMSWQHIQNDDAFQFPYLFGTATLEPTICNAQNNFVTTCASILDAADDVEEDQINQSLIVNDANINLVNDPVHGDQYVGLRFQNVNIPQGVYVDSAAIQFTSNSNSVGSSSMLIRAHDDWNSSSFSTAGSVSNRYNNDRTGNIKVWQPSSWLTGDRTSTQETPDLDKMVQEIVSQPQFDQGNPLSFMFHGTGQRDAVSFDADPTNAAELCVTYTMPSDPIIYPEYDPTFCASLSKTVWEASGILIDDYQSIWTHNDADNDNRLFEMDAQGNIIYEVFLQGITNFDWEEMAQDDDGNFYVGEFGSKSDPGYDELKIYKIANPRYSCDINIVPEVINFKYAESFIGDTEGMFYWDGFIYLFPKIHSENPTADHAGRLYIYRVPAIANPGSQYIAEQLYSISINNDYPHVPIDYHKVGGADISPDGKTIALSGGRRFWVIRDFTPGIFLDGEILTYDFPSQKQREAIGFADNSTLYIIDEDKSIPDNPNKGNIDKVDLCDLIPDLENCSCRSVFTNDAADNFQDLAEERENGNVNNGSSDIELTYDEGASSHQVIGMRFTDLGIPQGAIIKNAYVQFTTDETDNAEASRLSIWAEAIDHAPIINGSVNQDLSMRTKTNASASWSFVDWTSVGAAGRNQRTINCANVIQEIVDRVGWMDNNALLLLIEGEGSQTAESHYNCNRSAPRLFVEYCEGVLPCATNLSILNQTIPPNTYQVSQVIDSNADVMSSNQVIFKANTIVLNQNFNVDLGAVFCVDIDPCN